MTLRTFLRYVPKVTAALVCIVLYVGLCWIMLIDADHFAWWWRGSMVLAGTLLLVKGLFVAADMPPAWNAKTPRRPKSAGRQA